MGKFFEKPNDAAGSVSENSEDTSNVPQGKGVDSIIPLKLPEGKLNLTVEQAREAKMFREKMITIESELVDMNDLTFSIKKHAYKTLLKEKFGQSALEKCAFYIILMRPGIGGIEDEMPDSVDRLDLEGNLLERFLDSKYQSKPLN